MAQQDKKAPTSQDAGAAAVPQRPLGRTGIKVSALGLGGHHLGELKTVDEAIRLVHEAVCAAAVPRPPGTATWSCTNRR